MKSLRARFPFFFYPLRPFKGLADKLPGKSRTKLRAHLEEAAYSVRLLRYWWAGQALAAESRRLGRALTVADLGCERGWLKHFTPEGVVEKWIGLDWNPQREALDLAGYDEVHHAHFDERLPLQKGVADAVASLHVFEHLPRPGWAMAEASRLLKPGGVFLGCSPTMPHWLAVRRERYLRKRWKEGLIADGGHISVLSPHRWRTIAHEAGLQTEFVTGSHAVRKTGAFFENWAWWIRLNQLWGALFPSLGSECCLMARREAVHLAGPARLAPEDFHRRGLWAGLGATAALLLLSVSLWGAIQFSQADEKRVAAWLDAHQAGSDMFLLHDKKMRRLCGSRPDFQCVESMDELLAQLDTHPHAHVLVSVAEARRLTSQDTAHLWSIDSRLDFHGTDYLLLRQTKAGTPLGEYLLGAN